MNTKLLVSFVAIYLLVFGGVFFYVYDNREDKTEKTNSTLSWSYIKQNFGSIFKKVYTNVSDNKINLGNFTIFGNSSWGQHIYGKTCIVNEPGFYCDERTFAFNKDDKSVLLSFIYKGVEGQEFVGIKLTDGILCETSAKQQVVNGQNFYVKLDNCTFLEDNNQAKFELYYNRVGSSIEFKKKATGILILK